MDQFEILMGLFTAENAGKKRFRIPDVRDLRKLSFSCSLRRINFKLIYYRNNHKIKKGQITLPLSIMFLKLMLMIVHHAI